MIERAWYELLDYVGAGGFVMPPLVLITFVLWFALGWRFVTLQRGRPEGVRDLLKEARDGASWSPKGLIDLAVLKSVEVFRDSPPHLRAHLDEAFAPLEREMNRFGVLAQALVGVAPLLGLLGTVSGMIVTFDSLGDMALFSQTGGIAGGISQALISTQMGLAVAVPGLIVGRLLATRQRRLEIELVKLRDILCSLNEAR